MGAYGGHVVHLPRPRLVAIGARRERAYGAGVDAHAALLAINVRQIVGIQLCGAVGRNHSRAAAILNAQCEDVHAFTAHTHAAVAEDAARTVEVDDRRPFLLLAMILRLRIKAVRSSILEGHVLQLAFAACIAYRTVQRVVAEQQL